MYHYLTLLLPDSAQRCFPSGVAGGRVPLHAIADCGPTAPNLATARISPGSPQPKLHAGHVIFAFPERSGKELFPGPTGKPRMLLSSSEAAGGARHHQVPRGVMAEMDRATRDAACRYIARTARLLAASAERLSRLARQPAANEGSRLRSDGRHQAAGRDASNEA